MKEYELLAGEYAKSIYSTHQPCLLWALDNSYGDILELGAGDSSTTLLHENAKGRKIVSVDDDSKWINSFSDICNESHEIVLLDQTEEKWVEFICKMAKKEWGIVFVDQGTGEHIWRPTRIAAIKELSKCSDFVVAHDSDLLPEAKSLGIPFFEYIPTDKASENRNGPPTLILSKKRELPSK